MRFSIKDPIPEILAAWEALTIASDAHLSGDFGVAADYLRRANCPVVWSWLNPAWVDVDKHVVELQPVEDTIYLPKDERDPDRNIRIEVRREVLQRDGFRCRYCGIPVISADIRRFLATQYPDSVPWDAYVPSKQHAGLSCMWLLIFTQS